MMFLLKRAWCSCLLTGVAAFVRPVVARTSDVHTTNEFVVGAEWIASDFNRRTVPGSPLDLSSSVDAPAGKHGYWVVGNDGHGTWSEDRTARPRFLGVNLAWDATCPDKSVTDCLVDEIVRMGWNVVRLHQQDERLRRWGTDSSLDFSATALDRWDYLIARLKSRGVYITTDLYSSRSIGPKEPGLEAYAGRPRILKYLLPVNRAAMENWKQYARLLLAHVNPYTGLALKDDPVLLCLSMANEDAVIDRFGPWDSPLIKKPYEEIFAAWCDREGETRREASMTNAAFRGFVCSMQRKAHAEMKSFLCQELKVRCLLTSLNEMCGQDMFNIPCRNDFSMIDIHAYHAHAQMTHLGLREKSVGNSVTDAESVGSFFVRQPWARFWDRPFAMTEVLFCWPNVYRCEAGPFVGGYASFQDEDMVMEYSYAEGDACLKQKNYIVNPFCICNDPVAMCSSRISWFLFRRGDVKPARGRVTMVVPHDLAERENSEHEVGEEVLRLALLKQVGCRIGDASKGPEEIALEDFKFKALTVFDGCLTRALKTGVYQSDTGEISIDTLRRTVSVITEKSEAFSLRRGSASGRVLHVVGTDERPVTVSVHSLDGLPLAQSRSVILFHLTESANFGEKFEDASMKHVLSRGNAPVLIRRGKVRIRLTFPNEEVSVMALHSDGSAGSQVVADATGTYELSTDCMSGGVLAYHLKR